MENTHGYTGSVSCGNAHLVIYGYLTNKTPVYGRSQENKKVLVRLGKTEKDSANSGKKR